MEQRFIKNLASKVWTLLGGVGLLLGIGAVIQDSHVRPGWWIAFAGLFVISVLLLLAWDEHREANRFRKLYENERAIRQEIETKFKNLPGDTLRLLVEAVQDFSAEKLGTEWAQFFEYVERMTELNKIESAFLIRAFHVEHGSLFAIARIRDLSMKWLKIGDPFKLIKTFSNGIEIFVTKMFVHQISHDFRSVFFVSNEIPNKAISAEVLGLAEVGPNIELLRGFRAVPAENGAEFQGLDLSNAHRLIQRILEKRHGREGDYAD
jgi:hypothetical protein